MMWLIMRILLFTLLCAMNLWAEGVIIKYNSTSLSNITNWLQDKKRIGKFCGQGTIFTRTIRSDSGSKCEDLVTAALAEEVCRDYDDYNTSKCATKAATTLNGNKNPYHKTNTQILIDKLGEPKSKGLAEICKVIQYVFPKAECTIKDGKVSISEKSSFFGF